MKTLTKTGLLASGAAMMMTSLPAEAQRRHRDRDGIDAGDVIAGALIIGGIAAIASAASNNDRYNRNDRRYSGGYGYPNGGYNNNDYGYYNNGYNSRQAVDQCVRAAQQQANRYGWSRVTDVTRIDRIRGGYEVRGRLVVEQRGYRGGGNYGGGWNRNDRYGNRYDRYNDGYDKGRFSCTTRYGGVQDVDLSGLRNY